jgi:hypothetical protein
VLPQRQLAFWHFSLRAQACGFFCGFGSNFIQVLVRYANREACRERSDAFVQRFLEREHVVRTPRAGTRVLERRAQFLFTRVRRTGEAETVPEI